MKVGIFVPESNDIHLKTLSAFYKGVQKDKNVEVFVTPVQQYKECDVAVLFGVGKENVPISYPRGDLITKQRSRNLPVLILERGFVKRNDYYSAGYNGLNGRATFLNTDVKEDRWPLLDVPLQPWKEENRGDKILVCGQVPTDASVQHIDIIDWCATVCDVISKLSDREIVYRPHPLAIQGTPHILGTTTSYNSLQHDLDDAWAVITFNSNTAVDAVIQGIPVFSFDKGSMAYDVSNKDIDDIEDPKFFIRHKWANELAYTQWNLQEMEDGLAWNHLSTVFNE